MMRSATGAWKKDPWARGMFLNERRIIGPRPDPPQNVLPSSEDQLQDWKKDALVDEETFSERLNLAGLSREDFLYLLTADAAKVTGPLDGCSWLRLIEEITRVKLSHLSLPEAALVFPINEGTGSTPIPFLGFLQPFLQLGAIRLRSRLGASEECRCFEKHVDMGEMEIALLHGLAQKLLPQCTRTLVLELNAARMLNRLEGSTPEERFNYFSKTYLSSADHLLALLQEYPVLARSMAETVEHWVDMIVEFIGRLERDWSLIKQTFFSDVDPGVLVSARMGLSDPHRGERSVMLLEFRSGYRLVYKPKSLAVDFKFQHLLGWLDDAGLPLPQRVLTVSDRLSYGWVEFVEPASCETREEVERFYFRQGSYLALLYLVQAVDFHFENVIASGEYPVLVDLEGLFHHESYDGPTETAYQRAGEILSRSVLRVGLLPAPVWGKEGRPGVDLSGLGGEKGQALPQPVPMVEAPYTDSMRIVRRETKLGGGQNRPSLQGRPVEAAEFVAHIVSGFQETYRFLAHQRSPLESLLREFADVEVRHIIRPTRRYALFLQEEHHPDYLRDGLDRDRLLEKLWAETTSRPSLKRVVFSEQDDLRSGDIPLFTARPGQRHIWDSRGRCMEDYATRGSLADVLRRLADLNERDCAEQVDFLRGSIVSIDQYMPSHTQLEPMEEGNHVSREEFLSAAVDIGGYLQSKAIRGKKDVGWIGVSLEGQDHWRWVISPIRTDLYQGIGGIALFLAYLAAATGRSEFEELARAAVEPVRTHLHSADPPGYSNIGAFTGRASHLYLLSHLSSLWNEPSLLDEAVAGLKEIEAQIPNDKNLDLLGGVAGCAIILLDLYRRTGEARALAAARLCGDRLVQKATPLATGCGWIGTAATDPLAGFSHGSSGIAWALAELFAATGDERYLATAWQGIEYERSLFVPELGNWTDLRRLDGIPYSVLLQSTPIAWCHGAPSVALGRLLMLRHLDDPTFRSEITLGMETTVREGLRDNHSLCHGNLGNIDILYFASDCMRQEQWRQAAWDQSVFVLREVQKRHWQCGLPRNTETPSLMLGLAGIGLGLLRLGSPHRIPSVLRLEPAPCH